LIPVWYPDFVSEKNRGLQFERGKKEDERAKKIPLSRKVDFG
jgi:hypothetical protein